MWLTQWLGTLIRAQVFDVNNGNEDKADLVNPANYDLENTQNFYFRCPLDIAHKVKRLFQISRPSGRDGQDGRLVHLPAGKVVTNGGELQRHVKY